MKMKHKSIYRRLLISASEVTTVWRFKDMGIIIIIIITRWAGQSPR